MIAPFTASEVLRHSGWLKSLVVESGSPIVVECVAPIRRIARPVIAISGAISGLALTSSFYMLQVYDRVLPTGSLPTLMLLSIIALCAMIAFSILDAIRLAVVNRAATIAADALSSRLFGVVVSMASVMGGSVDTRNALRDVEAIRTYLASPALISLIDIPFCLLFLIILFLLHPLFLLAVLVSVCLLVGITIISKVLIEQDLRIATMDQVRAHSLVEDAIRNSDVLVGIGMADSFRRRWTAVRTQHLRNALNASEGGIYASAASRFVKGLLQSALLCIGAILVIQYNTTGGVMIAASILGLRAIAPLEVVIAGWSQLSSASFAFANVIRLIETAPRRAEGMRLPPPRGYLQVQSASYIAPATGRSVLSGVSFRLEPGDCLVVTGSSASGKSTLAKLLIGAWPCSSGKVRLDGADVYSWSRSQIGEHLGYLPQDVELFSGSVSENIARMQTPDPDKVVDAARLANAHDLILSLPQGYETEIGLNGTRLSGGQRQIIGLARALYGNPKFVVLDEPNANLDMQADGALAETLRSLRRAEAVVVVIAHRSSVLSVANKVLAIKDGKVQRFGVTAEVLQEARLERRRNVKDVAPTLEA